MDYNANRNFLWDRVAVSAQVAGTETFNSETQFFAVPKGTAGKTYADTNLLTARQIPRGTAFSIRRIMAMVLPGVTPSAYGAGAAAAAQYINDVYKLFTEATIAVQGLNDQVIQRIPLALAPASTFLKLFNQAYEGLADGAGVALNTQYATLAGEPFELAKPIDIIGGENFGALIEMPAGIAVPSTAACKIKLLYEGVYATQKQ